MPAAISVHPAFALCDPATRTGRVANWLALHARAAMAASWSDDSCIAATRLACLLARSVEMPARPVPLRAVVMNPAATRHRERTGELPASMDRPLDPEAPWCVGVGYTPDGGPPAEGRYGGHLVALLGAGDATVLVDLSLDQASRPARWITVGPLAVPVGRDAIPAGGALAVRLDHPGGDPRRACSVAYLDDPRHADGDWEDSPDWRETGRFARLLLALAPRLARELEGDT